MSDKTEDAKFEARHQAQVEEAELNENELENVSGGGDGSYMQISAPGQNPSQETSNIPA